MLEGAGMNRIIMYRSGAIGMTTARLAAFGMLMIGSRSIVDGAMIFAGNTTGAFKIFYSRSYVPIVKTSQTEEAHHGPRH